MLLYQNKTTQHFSIPSVPSERFITKQFSDGEIFLKIDPTKKNTPACVLASTLSLSDSIIELFLLLNAISQQHDTIHLIMPYFAYARQDHPNPGEAGSAEMMINFIQSFKPASLTTVHIHNPHMPGFDPLSNHVPFQFFLDTIQKNHINAIAAPDRGAQELAKKLGQKTGLPLILFEKHHPKQGETKIVDFEGNPQGKNVLIIDDIVSTATTITEAAYQLSDAGAHQIYAAATHGLLTCEALQKLNASPIIQLSVTNSIKQELIHPKMEVFDLTNFFSRLIDQYI